MAKLDFHATQNHWLRLDRRPKHRNIEPESAAEGCIQWMLGRYTISAEQ